MGKRHGHRRVAREAQRGREPDPVVGRQHPATRPEPREEARIVVGRAPHPEHVALLERDVGQALGNAGRRGSAGRRATGGPRPAPAPERERPRPRRPAPVVARSRRLSRPVRPTTACAAAGGSPRSRAGCPACARETSSGRHRSGRSARRPGSRRTCPRAGCRSSRLTSRLKSLSRSTAIRSFGLELLERGHRVDADRQHHGVGGLELRVVLGEGAHLCGAGLGERQRKEREQHVPARAAARASRRHPAVDGRVKSGAGEPTAGSEAMDAQAPFARSYRRATSLQLTTFHHAAR